MYIRNIIMLIFLLELVCYLNLINTEFHVIPIGNSTSYLYIMK